MERLIYVSDDGKGNITNQQKSNLSYLDTKDLNCCDNDIKPNTRSIFKKHSITSNMRFFVFQKGILSSETLYLKFHYSKLQI